MTPQTALRLAGPGAHLVHRPRRDVVHVYVGNLTPSGRHVPGAGRTVCRAHTRRLRVVARGQGWTADPRTRLCARCSACLAASLQARQAEHTDRAARAAAVAHLTAADIAGILVDPHSAAQVDLGAYLSLLRFGHAGCLKPVTGHDGQQWPSLHDLVHKGRNRFREPTAAELAFNANLATARAQRVAERAQIRDQREARINRLGINLAKPLPPKPSNRPKRSPR